MGFFSRQFSYKHQDHLRTSSSISVRFGILQESRSERICVLLLFGRSDKIDTKGLITVRWSKTTWDGALVITAGEILICSVFISSPGISITDDCLQTTILDCNQDWMSSSHAYSAQRPSRSVLDGSLPISVDQIWVRLSPKPAVCCCWFIILA